MPETGEEACCTRCRLHTTRNQVVVGRGPDMARVMVFGEAPGREEDKSGLGFQGAAGRVFEEILAYVGLCREDIWLANAVRCRPSVEGRKNRAPRPDEIQACQHWLMRDLAHIKPAVVVTLGRVAFESVTGRSWDSAHRAQPVPLRSGKGEAFALFHPAYLIYRRELKPAYKQDLDKLRTVLHERGIALEPAQGPWLSV